MPDAELSCRHRALQAAGKAGLWAAQALPADPGPSLRSAGPAVGPPSTQAEAAGGQVWGRGHAAAQHPDRR